MKTLASILLLCSAYGSVQASKYICSQNVMDDTVFTSVFETAEECRKYCTGIGSVCEETGDANKIDIFGVD